MLLSLQKDKLMPGMVLGQTAQTKGVLHVGHILSIETILELRKYYTGQELLVCEPRILENMSVMNRELVIDRVTDIINNRNENEVKFQLLSYIKIKMGANFRQVHEQLLDMNKHDTTAFKHSINVAWLSLYLGYELNLSETQLDILVQSAIVHDIGKLYVPYEVLSKKGKLTDIEFNMIKMHPKLGYKWARELLPENIALLVKYHHEREDGSGYPDGKYSKDISQLTKILSVADVLDALTENRVYRESYSLRQAVDILTVEALEGKLNIEIVKKCHMLFELSRY